MHVEKVDVGSLALRFSSVGLKQYQCEPLGQHVGQRCFVTVSCTEAMAEQPYDTKVCSEATLA